VATSLVLDALPITLQTAGRGRRFARCSSSRVDRGRPVAVLAPLPDRSPIERLSAAGDLVPSRQDLDDLPVPLPLGPGQEPPSNVLARLRRDER
jgi:hypothetical protein